VGQRAPDKGLSRQSSGWSGSSSEPERPDPDPLESSEPESSAPEPESSEPESSELESSELESSELESSELESSELESSEPEPSGSSAPCPALSESSETDRESPDSSRLVLCGSLSDTGFETSDDVVVGRIVVDGVVLVVVVDVVDEVTATVADSSAGTGFCQTDRGVDAPMLGKSVSRMA
jgi:hypothetical protein